MPGHTDRFYRIGRTDQCSLVVSRDQVRDVVGMQTIKLYKEKYFTKTIKKHFETNSNY